MSILIKGMEKPEECYCCPCSTINMNGRWGKCNLLGRDYAGDPHKIYDDCPLVEIPPHGRLIDADALKTKLNNIHDFLLGDCEFSELAMSDKARIDELINCIAEVVNAPTVIESEEQKHEL